MAAQAAVGQAGWGLVIVCTVHNVCVVQDDDTLYTDVSVFVVCVCARAHVRVCASVCVCMSVCVRARVCVSLSLSLSLSLCNIEH